MNLKMNKKSYSERFTYEELEKILQRVQYEIDKMYGDGMFKVIYNDSYSFFVIPTNYPVVRQIVLDVKLDGDN